MRHCKQRLKNYICRTELIEGSEGDKRRQLIEGNEGDKTRELIEENEDGPKNLFSEDCVDMKKSLLTDRYATYIFKDHSFVIVSIRFV